TTMIESIARRLRSSCLITSHSTTGCQSTMPSGLSTLSASRELRLVGLLVPLLRVLHRGRSRVHRIAVTDGRLVDVATLSSAISSRLSDAAVISTGLGTSGCVTSRIGQTRGLDLLAELDLTGRVRAVCAHRTVCTAHRRAGALRALCRLSVSTLSSNTFGVTACQGHGAIGVECAVSVDVTSEEPAALGAGTVGDDGTGTIGATGVRARRLLPTAATATAHHAVTDRSAGPCRSTTGEGRHHAATASGCTDRRVHELLDDLGRRLLDGLHDRLAGTQGHHREHDREGDRGQRDDDGDQATGAQIHHQGIARITVVEHTRERLLEDAWQSDEELLDEL